jgi:hypothetical protein
VWAAITPAIPQTRDILQVCLQTWTTTAADALPLQLQLPNEGRKEGSQPAAQPQRYAGRRVHAILLWLLLQVGAQGAASTAVWSHLCLELA